MEPVRRVGMQLLTLGATPSEVAREMGVSRTAASNWAARAARECEAGPAADPIPLPPPHRARLRQLLAAGATAYGFPSEAWTIARVAVLIEYEFGLKYSTLQAWRQLEADVPRQPPPTLT